MHQDDKAEGGEEEVDAGEVEMIPIVDLQGDIEITIETDDESAQEA